MSRFHFGAFADDLVRCTNLETVTITDWPGPYWWWKWDADASSRNKAVIGALDNAISRLQDIPSVKKVILEYDIEGTDMIESSIFSEIVHTGWIITVVDPKMLAFTASLKDKAQTCLTRE
ncbi:hypothetical protein PG999_007603 [Apiospora kogelbergensis]|uniref:Uncharacterized protein n=1 Tax=Apiospora kogelbergensis TaxID=1337665 RepID=A0AAW0QU47_9PEZI